MDITFKNIPDGIGEEKCREWMAVLVERWVNAKVNENPVVKQVTQEALTAIDTYRTSNNLKAKFAVAEEVKPVEEKPVEEKPVEEVIAPKEIAKEIVEEVKGELGA